MQILDLAQFKLEAILFTFFRISGLFLIAPLFSQRGIPVNLKIMFGLLFAVIISPVAVPASFSSPTHLLEVVMLAVRELVVGFFLGFIFLSLFVGVQMAGAFTSFQIGFSIVNVIDPLTSEQVSIFSQFKFIIATLLFFLLNGHHLMLQALVSSYRLIPLGEAVFRFTAYEEVARLLTGMFLIAIKLSAPVMAALLLTDIGMGVIARTVPQMNIFIVGFPLKIGVGMFFMAASLPFFGYVFSKALKVMGDESLNILAHLAR